MASMLDRELTNLSGKITILGARPYFDGSYSNVYQGLYNGQMVAVKVLKPVGPTHTMRRKALRERVVSCAMNHPNILPYIGYVEDDERFEPFGALVSLWCKNGDTVGFLKEHGTSLSLNQRIALWKGVVEGVNYFHRLNPSIVHGDLKPLNILLDDNLVPRICDFGLARIILEESRSGMTTTTVHTGTERYLAYELVVNDDILMPTVASDVHALGCIGLDFIFLQLPYSHRETNVRGHIFHDIRQGIPPASRPVDLCDSEEVYWNIISSCWNQDPNSRPDTEALLSDLHAASSLLAENLIPNEVCIETEESVIESNPQRVIYGTPSFTLAVSSIAATTLTVRAIAANKLSSSYSANDDSSVQHPLRDSGVGNMSISANMTTSSTMARDLDDTPLLRGKSRGRRSQVAPEKGTSLAPSRLPTKDWHPTAESLPTGDDRLKFDMELKQLDEDHRFIVTNFGGNTFWTQWAVLQKIVEYHRATGEWPMRVDRTGTNRTNEEGYNAECMICGRGKRTQKFKVRHIAAHLILDEWRLKPWRCMYCSTAYSSNDGSLKKHLNKAHNVHNEVDVEINLSNLPPSGSNDKSPKKPVRKLQRNAGPTSQPAVPLLPHKIGIGQGLLLSATVGAAVAPNSTGRSTNFVTGKRV